MKYVFNLYVYNFNHSQALKSSITSNYIFFFAKFPLFHNLGILHINTKIWLYWHSVANLIIKIYSKKQR